MFGRFFKGASIVQEFSAWGAGRWTRFLVLSRCISMGRRFFSRLSVQTRRQQVSDVSMAAGTRTRRATGPRTSWSTWPSRAPSAGRASRSSRRSPRRRGGRFAVTLQQLRQAPGRSFSLSEERYVQFFKSARTENGSPRPWSLRLLCPYRNHDSSVHVRRIPFLARSRTWAGT